VSGRWILVCVCLAVAGCNAEPRLEAPAAEALRGDVADARAAARDGDRAAALSALDRVHDGIEQAEAGGELDEREAANLRQGVRRAKRRVDQELAEPTATATPAGPATGEPGEGPDPPEGGEPGTGNDEHKGKGEVEGKGKRNEGNGDGDEKGDD
jgi:hypothetical protein